MLDSPTARERGILLVTVQLDSASLGGRELLSRLNHDALDQIYGDKLLLVELPRHPLLGIGALLGAFRGHIDGLDGAVIQRIASTIQGRDIGCVFLDGSNLGAVAKAISGACPEVQVVTFFHNCEARFFWGALRQARTVRSLGIFVANYLAERRAVRFSDKRICLNERDSALLEKLYGRAATHVSAMAMCDMIHGELSAPHASPHGKYALFVGGAFYANKAGIEWYCRNVAPYVSMRTCVVGRGLEAARSDLEQSGNVTVVGEVGDLARWYRDAHVVVAPIFDGSGMKTKVAEALMHGKRILGTPEAFTGYEEHVAKIGIVCRNAREFIAAVDDEMKRSQAMPSATFVFIPDPSKIGATTTCASRYHGARSPTSPTTVTLPLQIAPWCFQTTPDDASPHGHVGAFAAVIRCGPQFLMDRG